MFLALCVTQPGDSGAPAWVPRWGGNKLLGHAIGCGGYGGANRTIIVSAFVIEEYLGVTLVVGG